VFTHLLSQARPESETIRLTLVKVPRPAPLAPQEEGPSLEGMSLLDRQKLGEFSRVEQLRAVSKLKQSTVDLWGVSERQQGAAPREAADEER
jgi:hypothetical protein